jgi:hypothetical protein
MDVNNNDKFVLTRLEKEMLDVAEKNVHSVLGVQWRLVSQTVLMDLNLSRYTLTVHCRANEYIVHNGRSTIC